MARYNFYGNRQKVKTLTWTVVLLIIVSVITIALSIFSQGFTNWNVNTWFGNGVECEHVFEDGVCIECGGLEDCEHEYKDGVCKECGSVEDCEHEYKDGICVECGEEECAHEYEDGVCVECGEKESEENSGTGE